MLSKYTYWLCCFVILFVSITFYPKWKQWGSEATISWDVSGYYEYLPALFIYKDISQLKFHDSLMNKYEFTPYMTQYNVVDSLGSRSFVYSSGMAVQYLPFFLIAHKLAPYFDYPQDGYSRPYQMAISFGAIFMAFIGLWFFRKILLEYFSENVASVTMILVILGTNYFNFIAIDAGMSHCWIFNLYCMLIYVTIQYYKEPTKIKAIAIGFLVGLIVLTRPTDIICILIPLLWNLNSFSFQPFKDRIIWIKQRWAHYGLAIFVCALVGSIQLIYWKYTTGHWVFYSYTGLGFKWFRPFFKEFMYSYRVGWLVYTPVMFLAILGLFFLLKKKFQVVPISILLFFNVWYVTAWEIWWYGGRAMIQTYPIWAFPLALFVQFLMKSNVRKWMLFLLVVLGLFYNYWFTKNVHGGIIDYSNMTKNYFWKSVGRFSIADEDRKYLDILDAYDGPIKDEQKVFHFARKNTMKDNDSCYLTNLNGEVDTLITVTEFPKQNFEWVRVELDFEVSQMEYDKSFMHQMTLAVSHANLQLRTNTFRPERICANKKSFKTHFEMKLPTEMYDKIELIVNKPTYNKSDLWLKSLNLLYFNEN